MDELPPEYVAVTQPKRPRPVPRLGALARLLRQSRGLTQVKLAAKSGLTNDLISRLEKGENIQIENYETYAKALGYKGVLEMFRAGSDPAMRRLLRYWPLLDDAARKAVLVQVKGMIDADEESAATVDEP